MNADLSKILQYWRTSLADSALGEGTFRQKDRGGFVEISFETICAGVLTADEVATLFAGQPQTISAVPVRLWPLVAARLLSHGVGRGDGLPELVAPVVTEAVIDREGIIHPKRNTIARNILAPLAQGELAIGTVDALDLFLTETPLPAWDATTGWEAYRAHCRKMLNEVVAGWPNGDDLYKPLGLGFVKITEQAAATVRQTVDLYDTILATKPDVPLLAQFARPQAGHKRADSRIEGEFARRLGHSNPQFPLAEHQRQVLAWLNASGEGDVLAVNGPPGTGKTTMVLSAVAGLWVKAALEGGDPPIIVAASTNNQAVTNIIDAFGKDFAAGEGAFAGRWIRDVTSFGMFLPSKSREPEASARYQTESFQAKMETEAAYLRAKEDYLRAAALAFPQLRNPGVQDVVSALQELIRREVAQLASADRAGAQLHQALASVRDILGDNVGQAKSELRQNLAARQAQVAVFTEAAAGLQRYLASESVFIALLNFLPQVARKRLLRAELAVGDLAKDLGDYTTLAAFESRLREQHAKADSISRAAQAACDKADEVERQAARAIAAWDAAVAAFGAGHFRLGQSQMLDQALDTGTRFRLFLLATHYWEGRWLLAMEADLAKILRDAKKQTPGRASAIPRWQRRMMLTPCAVATFASLPGKMTYSRKVGETFQKDYFFNFIDLLIVDEAGQVLPEAAAASFALAKRALVIGDTQQIAPISSVAVPVDFGNLQASGLLGPDPDEAEIAAMQARGFASTSGSAMRLAQEASLVSPYPDLEKGLYLFEHRRCYDDIINYCNALCYGGALRPMRGRAPKGGDLPAMGYVHVDGRAISINNGRANLLEAETIAAWLAANRARLEAQYGTRLEDCVAVVTPFVAQVRQIRHACAAHGIATDAGKGMTIGTVHALQGAERPVVLFSPVYSKHADGSFIDSAASMLNVTVSRAKDSFLVFGDMDVFSGATAGTPRAVLSGFLHADPQNALDFVAAPRPDLRAEGEFQTLRDAAEHDAFLLNALASDAKRVTIVSPWIIVSTMQKTGIMEGIAQAVRRGADVHIYADPLLNATPDRSGRSNMDQAAEALSAIGVQFHSVPQVHSKIVAIDDRQLCIGSYNWLSADRSGSYARHETSFVYGGPHMAAEIDTIIASLRVRQA